MFKRILLNAIALLGILLIFTSGVTLLIFGFRHWGIPKEVLKGIPILNEKIHQNILELLPSLAISTGFIHIVLASVNLYSFIKILRSFNRPWRFVSLALSIVGIIVLAGCVLGPLLILIYIVLYKQRRD